MPGSVGTGVLDIVICFGVVQVRCERTRDKGWNPYPLDGNVQFVHDKYIILCMRRELFFPAHVNFGLGMVFLQVTRSNL